MITAKKNKAEYTDKECWEVTRLNRGVMKTCK